jgi:hypothetical protein
MTKPYDASVLNEPRKAVLLRICVAVALALGAAVAGGYLDHVHRCSAFCGDSGCHWFQRSGALVVLCGTYLAFRSGAVLIKTLDPPRENPHQKTLLNPNPKESRTYGLSAFALLALGTLIWDFGDFLSI